MLRSEMRKVTERRESELIYWMMDISTNLENDDTKYETEYNKLE